MSQNHKLRRWRRRRAFHCASGTLYRSVGARSASGATHINCSQLAKMYTRDELETMKRKEIQAIAKQNGVKANMKTALIIDALVDAFAGAAEEGDAPSEPAAAPATSEAETVEQNSSDADADATDAEAAIGADESEAVAEESADAAASDAAGNSPN